MFLTETNVWDIIKKQYYFKMKAYTGAFSTLRYTSKSLPYFSH